MTTLVNLKKKELNKMGYRDFEEWQNASPDHVYIGRNMSLYVKGAFGSKWGNPFKKGRVDYILERYAQHVRDDPALYNSLMELDGKVLGCWCTPEPCHGNVLIRLVNEVKNKK